MQAIDLINLCAREYNDVAFARIAKSPSGNLANWLDYLNDAQRAVVLARPDANAVTESVLLAAGTRQTLPSGGLQLLDASRNMGTTGTAPGDTVRFAERDVQDMVSRRWHKAQVGTTIRDVFYNDKKDPLVYWVTPPVGSGVSVYLEISYAKVPTAVTNADAGAINISDAYAAPLQMWMLYRGFSLATQAMNQFQRAQSYFAAFFNLLNVKMRNDMFFSPNQSDVFPGAANAAR